MQLHHRRTAATTTTPRTQGWRAWLQQLLRLGTLVTLLVAAWTPRPAAASAGDASPAFQQCLQSCQRSGCACAPPRPGCCAAACQLPSSPPMPLALRLTRWDCPADCAYHCMWSIERPKQQQAARGRSGAGGGTAPPPVDKYFGKWPFLRVAGAQEPASVVFSIANLAAHAHNLGAYLHRLRQRRRLQPYPFAALWPVYGLVSINAWTWSAVFHTRDTAATERLDYFSAGLLVAVGLGAAVTRAVALARPAPAALAWLALAALYLRHVHFMAYVKFDYGYNMKVCIAAGLASAATWLAWAARSRHPGRRHVYAFLGCIHAAMLLEVLDFPPVWGVFDAHALWHAATAPLTYVWYRFIAADVQLWGAAAGGGSGSGSGQPCAAAKTAAAAAGGSGASVAVAVPGRLRLQPPDLLLKRRNGH